MYYYIDVKSSGGSLGSIHIGVNGSHAELALVGTRLVPSPIQCN